MVAHTAFIYNLFTMYLLANHLGISLFVLYFSYIVKL